MCRGFSALHKRSCGSKVVKTSGIVLILVRYNPKKKGEEATKGFLKSPHSHSSYLVIGVVNKNRIQFSSKYFVSS